MKKSTKFVSLARHEQRVRNVSSKTSFGPRSSVVIPNHTRCKMKYAFAGTRSLSTGWVETVWSGTNLSDPGGGSDTRQPIGYDEMALWYINYVNHGAKVKIVINIVNTNIAPTSTLVGGDVVLYASSTSSAVSLLASALSQPGAKFSRLGGPRVLTLEMAASNESVLGTSTHGPDSAVGLTASGPAAFNWYFHFGVAADAVYTDCTMEYIITVMYDVTFFNRKLLELPTFQDHFARFVRENESSWLARGQAEIPESKKAVVITPASAEIEEKKELSKAQPGEAALVLRETAQIPPNAPIRNGSGLGLGHAESAKYVMVAKGSNRSSLSADKKYP